MHTTPGHLQQNASIKRLYTFHSLGEVPETQFSNHCKVVFPSLPELCVPQNIIVQMLDQASNSKAQDTFVPFGKPMFKGLFLRYRLLETINDYPGTGLFVLQLLLIVNILHRKKIPNSELL